MSHYRLFGCAKAHSNKFRALYQPVFSLFHSLNRHWGQAAELKYLEILSHRVSDSLLNFWSREHLSSVVQFKETHFFIQARTFLFLLKPERIMAFVTFMNNFFFQLLFALVCDDKLSPQNFNYDVTFYFLPAIVVKRNPKKIAIVLKYYFDINLWKIELCEYDRSSSETKLTKESLVNNI